ncbi:hypothetical protein NQ315_013054, partial [Exocentrus adspersus]
TLNLILSEESFSKCFEELGCIETNSRWYDSKLRPVNLPPVDRHIIKTDFLLIKLNKSHSDNLLYNNMMAKYNSIVSAGYNNDSDIIILIHDFTANGYTGWVKHLAKVVLDKTPHKNIISVDWQRGAEPPYDQAISNARVVALEIILLLKELKEKADVDFSQVHVIGHGVGAHIAGYVGTTYNSIKKITGLDPSGPRFEGLPDLVKLNPTDAKYVEVLHTDAYDSRSQGAREAMGHSDFYVNNGLQQPDCPMNTTFPELISIERNSLNGGQISPGCNHKRAFKYFIEAVTGQDCVFLGIKCDSYEDFNDGKCTSCANSNGTCRTFGFTTYKNAVAKSSFFVNTAGHPPYCLYVYRVTVSLSPGSDTYFGYFDFILIDDRTHASQANLADANFVDREFHGGSKNTYVYYVQPPRLSKLKEAKVRWNEKKKIYCFIYCKQVINVDWVSFKFLGTGKNDEREEEKLCPMGDKTEVENGSYRTFVRCGSGNDTLSSLPYTTTTSRTSSSSQSSTNMTG